MSDVPIRLDERDGVVVVTLDRSDKKHALTIAMRDALVELFAAVDRRDEIAALVLTATNPGFCAGVDLAELRAAAPSGPRPTNPAAALRAMQTPSIVAVNGVCVTGGLEIALSGDILVASTAARFADAHAKLGLVPAWGLSALLPRAVGAARARELAVTGRFVDAAEAVAIGLAQHVVAPDELLDRALALAGQIAACDRKAVRAILGLQARTAHLSLDDAIAEERRVAGEWRR